MIRTEDLIKFKLLYVPTSLLVGNNAIPLISRLFHSDLLAFCNVFLFACESLIVNLFLIKVTVHLGMYFYTGLPRLSLIFWTLASL